MTLTHLLIYVRLKQTYQERLTKRNQARRARRQATPSSVAESKLEARREHYAATPPSVAESKLETRREHYASQSQEEKEEQLETRKHRYSALQIQVQARRKRLFHNRKARMQQLRENAKQRQQTAAAAVLMTQQQHVPVQAGEGTGQAPLQLPIETPSYAVGPSVALPQHLCVQSTEATGQAQWTEEELHPDLGPQILPNTTRAVRSLLRVCNIRLRVATARAPAGRRKSIDDFRSDIQGFYQDFPQTIGDMDLICADCGARFWRGEGTQSGNVPKICCGNGRYSNLAVVSPPPAVLHRLYTNVDSRRSNIFYNNIQAFNNSLAFASMSYKRADDLPGSGGPPVFRMCGESYHLLAGSVQAPPNVPAGFMQIYFCTNELQRRQIHTRVLILQEHDQFWKIYKQ